MKSLSILSLSIVMFANCQVVLPEPKNCNQLTLQNLCLKCDQGFALIESENICLRSSNQQIQAQKRQKLQKTSKLGLDKLQDSQIEQFTQNQQTQPSGLSIQIDQDLNCKKKGTQHCLECYYAFYFDKPSNKCLPVNSLCKTWNKQGRCQSCFSGFSLSQQQCLEKTPQSYLDPFCFQYQNQQCKKCAKRFYFNKERVCKNVHPYCKKWDQETGQCYQCYTGFAPKGNQCLKQILNIATTSNSQKSLGDVQNCARKNKNNECQKCSFRFYLQNGSCKQVSDQCKTWNQANGQCIDCYQGFIRIDGECYAKLPYCSIQVPQGCVQCQNSYYLNEKLGCNKVSSLCKAYDPFTGYCTSCNSPTYKLNKGKCTI